MICTRLSRAAVAETTSVVTSSRSSICAAATKSMLHRPHRKGDAVLDQFGVMHAEIAQELGPAPLEEVQIGRVIDVAGKVGVFVVDADGEAMASSTAAPRYGGSPDVQIASVAPASIGGRNREASERLRGRSCTQRNSRSYAVPPRQRWQMSSVDGREMGSSSSTCVVPAESRDKPGDRSRIEDFSTRERSGRSSTVQPSSSAISRSSVSALVSPNSTRPPGSDQNVFVRGLVNQHMAVADG